MDKVPVEVEIEDRSDGQVIPRTIIWCDGRRFPISRVLFHGSSLANEYEGIRYTVIIGSAEKYIYRVNHEWYVMALTGGAGSEEICYL